MKTKVSIVKCEDYDEERVFNAVKKAIDDIGFKFIEKSKVLIKPNVLSQHKSEDSITTHPSLVDAVCNILKGRGCEIIIGESSGFYMDGGTQRGLELSGIDGVAKKYNAKLIPFEEAEIRKINDPDAKVLKEINLAKPVFEVDLVINMPKLKTHGLMRYTGAVKNLLGTMPGGLKQKCHLIAKDEDDFGNLLLDIYRHIKPQLNIMDGVIGLEGEGPGSAGIPKETGLILASKNAIALDIVAEQIIGFKPEDVTTTKYAIERGLFSSFDDVEIVGEFVKVDYKKPKNINSLLPGFLKTFVFRSAIVYPEIEIGRCKNCMVCVNVCPVKTIKVKEQDSEKIVYVDKKNCISCYCCHELCPHNAIDLKSSRFISILRKAREALAKRK
tara:strand:- start:17 stop:1171 length:1155 start_codon:yes stop_codon:yes gene_type:complete